MLGKCISGIQISKILLGRTQTPAWASQLRCSQGRALPDMVCPPVCPSLCESGTCLLKLPNCLCSVCLSVCLSGTVSLQLSECVPVLTPSAITSRPTVSTLCLRLASYIQLWLNIVHVYKLYLFTYLLPVSWTTSFFTTMGPLWCRQCRYELKGTQQHGFNTSMYSQTDSPGGSSGPGLSLLCVVG